MTERCTACDEPLRNVVRLVAHLATELYSALLSVGGEARAAHWRWTSAAPQPGDLVVELSTSWRTQGPGFDHFTRIGRYLGTRQERIVSTDDPDGFFETYEVIVLADGCVFEWFNCRFMRVPEEHLSLLTGTSFWHGSFGGGPVHLRSGESADLREFCRERFAVDLEPAEPLYDGRLMWRWPRGADGKPVATR